MALKIRDLFISIGIEADEDALKRIDKGMNQIKSSANLTAFAIKSVTIAIAGMTVASGLFLKQAGDFEQATIAFETMLDSASKAKSLLIDLQQFAAKTPFQFAELVTLSKRLLAFQFRAEEIIPTLNDLGNIAAGVGREKLPQLIKALGDVRAAGRLRGLEVRQFIDAGVGIEKAVAAVTGKSIEEVGELISKRQISFEITRKAVELLSRTKFNNLMIKQSKTLLGALSNTIDILQILAIEIGTEMLPAAKQILTEFLAFLEINRKMIKSKIIQFFKDFGKFMIIVFRASKNLFLAVVDLAKIFGGLEKIIKAVAIALGLIIAFQTLAAIGNITLGIWNMVKAMQALRVATLLVNAAVAVWPILIGAAVVALAFIIEDIVSFFQGKDSFTGRIIDKWIEEWEGLLTKVKTILAGIKEAILEAGRGIADLPLFKIFGAARTGVSGAISSIGGLFSNNSPAASPVSSSVSNNPSINVNSPINVSVPEGTPPELVGSSLQAGIADVFSGLLRNAGRDLSSVTEF